MRTLTGLLVVALLVPALAGAANGEPKKALTKKDQATAHSVVVKRSDLGQGFTAMARDKNQTLPKGARCGPLDVESQEGLAEAEPAGGPHVVGRGVRAVADTDLVQIEQARTGDAEGQSHDRRDDGDRQPPLLAADVALEHDVTPAGGDARVDAVVPDAR